MKCILSKSLNPYFNLAAEEFILKNFKDNFFIVWKSEPTVIVGKHQNTLSEINYKYIIENNINIARRLSGGGTVYHDTGNVNFTFIQNGEPGKLIDFKKRITPIITFLETQNIPLVLGGKNDLLVHDHKISGNAEHIYKNRILHHGTLLFSSDIEVLKKSLKVKPESYTGKAVQSNRSQVTNLKSFFPVSYLVNDFEQSLFNYILGLNPESEIFTMSRNQINEVEKLAKTKYKTWEWIFGYSPKYCFKRNKKISGKYFNIEIDVKEGVIQEIYIKTNRLDNHVSDQLKTSLRGCRHNYFDVKNCLDIYLGRDLTEELIFDFF